MQGVVRELKVPNYDFIEQFMNRVIIKGPPPRQHEVEDHTTGPDVRHLPIIARVLDNLWGDIV